MRYKLEQVVWEITWKCNAKCMHCGSDCISVEKQNELTTAECLDVVADLKQLGTEIIFLAGGDPLCRKDFGAIAAAIKSQGMNVAFISNGLGLNDDNLAVIKAIDPIAFGLSLDAAEAYMHDYIRGHKGCFDNVISSIKKLQEMGVEVSIVSTIHKLNFSQIPKIRELLLNLGVRYWQLQYADFIGRMPSEAMITEAQFWEMAKFILDTKQNYSDKIDLIGADVSGYMSDFAMAIQGHWYGCQAGMKVLGIGSDGTVRGCLSQQFDRYIEGNVRERSIIDIWNDPNAFQYNRHFDCSMLTGYCKDCRYRSVCKGGCTVAATAREGQRCNPYCLYKIETEGFSNLEQARTLFYTEEIADLYNPIRKLPQEFYKKYKP
jgi:radical SAM protein with 4Fe4S-binding SPASM domain